MPTFTATIFAEGPSFRVVIEGFGSAEARSLFEAEEIARRLIEWRVGASYPDRTTPDPPPDAVGVMRFSLTVVRSDDAEQRRDLWRRFEAAGAEYGLGALARRRPSGGGRTRPRASPRKRRVPSAVVASTDRPGGTHPPRVPRGASAASARREGPRRSRVAYP